MGRQSFAFRRAQAFPAVGREAHEMLEGSRSFDIAWGTATAAVCFALGAVVLRSWLRRRRTGAQSLFGAAIDPNRRLQFAWGLFAMGMGGTNLGCRYIDHRYLRGVHEGFFALTLLVVAVLGSLAVRLALERAAANQAPVRRSEMARPKTA